MTSKTPSTTINFPAEPKNPGAPVSMQADPAAKWTEARLAYPLYAALVAQFNLAPLPHLQDELSAPRPTRDVLDSELKWFDEIDEKIRAYQIRQLPSEILNASEQSLRAFLQRQLWKADKTTVDRDKIDLLLVQYFALCAPEELYRERIKLEDVARVLQPALPQAEATPLEWCEPLDKILATLEECQSLHDVMENGLLEQGRLVKDSAGCMFYDPAALVAFCRFNFLLRRAFIRLLHADLSAVQQAAKALEARGVKTVDCRCAGLSAAETTTRVRYLCDNWRQPFQKDYTENSVRRTFEQLLALRADLEEALGRANTRASSGAAPVKAALPDSPELAIEAPVVPLSPPISSAKISGPIAPAPKNEEERPAAETSAPNELPGASGPSKPAKAAPSVPAPPAVILDPEKCLEAIWEQLIAVPLSRGRSMSTVVLQDTKVLLSSWEVAAFVAEGGQEAEDLRRAVVARALLAVAMDQRKRSGEESALASALLLARSEVSYFQGRVEQAKRAKNTEAAVNLGISAKRLLSFIEESEKLQP
jgi:hypothetical protein